MRSIRTFNVLTRTAGYLSFPIMLRAALPKENTKQIAALQAVEPRAGAPNEFDPRKARVGDVVAGWKIASLDTKLWENGELMSAVVEFEDKEITVSGTYENLPEDSEFYNGIVFTLDAESEKLIPKIKSGEQSTGNRIIFKSPEAEEAFKPQGSKGKATIVISGFSFHYWPKDDYRDNTKFVKIIENL